MPNLIATKSFRYATRHLVAGDAFEANDRDARLLVGVKRARLVDDKPAAPAASPVKPAAALKPPAESKVAVSETKAAETATETAETAEKPLESGLPAGPADTPAEVSGETGDAGDVQPLTTTGTPAIVPGADAPGPGGSAGTDSEGGTTDQTGAPPPADAGSAADAATSTITTVAARKTTGKRAAAGAA